MNIAEAKEQIIWAMKAYFEKNDLGEPRIPTEKQRPVFLVGPPGVGKTAVMEQIAAELGVGLVSYSMTHHTRQSALGLPVITKKEYEGFSYQVSEYTMSEIIGAVYDTMRESGVREGILFLDEINCISETLAPCMLQFLQYKVFGQHRIPDGWIVVTAGNPPEYNRSVRDFDIVTWDRLKRIDVEPDYDVWKDYAVRKGVHPSVTTYLAAKRGDFYKVGNTAEGRRFVTARGWDDLSEMIKLYEENGFPVNEKLICQYLQDPVICREFAIYYDLFNKYRSDYRIEDILDGKADESIVFRASKAKLDERVSLLGLIYDAVTTRLRAVCEDEEMMTELTRALKEVKAALHREKTVAELIKEKEDELEKKLESGRKASCLSQSDRRKLKRTKEALSKFRADVLKADTAAASCDTEVQDASEHDMDTEAPCVDAQSREAEFEIVQQEFRKKAANFRTGTEDAKAMLENVFAFCEKAFADGDELLLFVTELTAGYYSAWFIGHYGCDAYYLHNRELQFEERQQELLKRVEEINWEV